MRRITALLTYIFLGGSILASSQFETRSIYAAIHLGDTIAIRNMLREDTMAVLTAKLPGGVTPLHYAVGLDRMQIVHLLIKAGISVDARTDNKTTPLHWAADKKATDCLRLLLKHGADVSTEALNGWTPLHFSCKHNDPESARFLIAAGSDINAAKAPEGTPLHVAATVGSADMIQLLLEQGASVSATDKDGRTPLDVATEPEIKNRIVKAGGKGHTPQKEPDKTAEPKVETAAKTVTTPEKVDSRQVIPRTPRTEPLPREASVIRAAAAGNAPPLPPRLDIADGPEVPVHPADLPVLTAGEPAPEEPEEPEESVTLHTVRLLDGSVYRGEMRRERFHGHGVLELENGQKYEGQWRRGRKHGIGDYSYPSGDRYSGEWSDDAPHGRGVYHYGNGGRVEGVWRNGVLRHGSGIYVSTDGSRHKGVWRNNELIETLPMTEEELIAEESANEIIPETEEEEEED